jgi:hypothetical protein
MLAEFGTPADPGRLTADDTLGRILRRAEPWANRYVRLMGGFGAILFAFKAYMVHRLVGGGFLEANAWINQHDPLLIPKIVGSAAFLAAMVLLLLLAITGVRRSPRA